MDFISETIKKILLENRVDDVKKKFPNLDPAIINYFVAVDPSGNNKYLEWMCKAMSHEPTHWSLGDKINNHEYQEGIWGETAGYLSKLVTKFHELLPYLVHPNEKGEKEGTTDLYQYKFTDSEMIHYLIYDLEQAEERRDIKETQKRLIKGADKLFENSEWLVIRPKTHEASCHYGAGTKWCTTMKSASGHFTRETDRTFLIYVINKKESPTNVTNKVAWQIPYHKDNKWILNTENGPNTKRIKLWDTEDSNIVNDQKGRNYFDNVPMYIKENIFNYIQTQMDEMFSKTGFNEDERIQAIAEYFGYTQEDIDSIEEKTYTNYGMRIFLVDSQDAAYCVADEDELEQAKTEWAEMYIESEGVESVLSYNNDVDSFIYIRNQEELAKELTDNHIEDQSDEDVLDFAKHSNTIKQYWEEYGITSSVQDDLDEELEEISEQLSVEDITLDEYTIERDRLESEKKDLIKDLDKLFRTIKNMVYDVMYDDYIQQMQHPFEWLKDWGWVEKGQISPDAFKRGIVGVDEEALVVDYASGLDNDYFSSTGRWHEVRVGGTYYYIFPTDV